MATRYDVKSKWSPPVFLAINELFSQFQCKVTKSCQFACMSEDYSANQSHYFCQSSLRSMKYN